MTTLLSTRTLDSSASRLCGLSPCAKRIRNLAVFGVAVDELPVCLGGSQNGDVGSDAPFSTMGLESNVAAVPVFPPKSSAVWKASTLRWSLHFVAVIAGLVALEGMSVRAANTVERSPSAGWVHSLAEGPGWSLLIDGMPTDSGVSYPCNDWQAFIRSDLKFDETLTAKPRTLFAAGASTNLIGLSKGEALQPGEINDDSGNIVVYFRLFKGDYDAVNRPGALAGTRVRRKHSNPMLRFVNPTAIATLRQLR